MNKPILLLVILSLALFAWNASARSGKTAVEVQGGAFLLGHDFMLSNATGETSLLLGKPTLAVGFSGDFVLSSKWDLYADLFGTFPRGQGETTTVYNLVLDAVPVYFFSARSSKFRLGLGMGLAITWFHMSITNGSTSGSLLSSAEALVFGPLVQLGQNTSIRVLSYVQDFTTSDRVFNTLVTMGYAL